MIGGRDNIEGREGNVVGGGVGLWRGHVIEGGDKYRGRGRECCRGRGRARERTCDRGWGQI